VRNGTALSLGQARHAGAFGQVLPNQTVGIFVAPACPGMMRRREVEFRCGAPLNGFIVVKLRTVIGRDGLESAGMSLNERDRTLVERFFGSNRQVADQEKACLSFNQAQDAVLGSRHP
jgi:hypothetical protein